MIQPRAPPPKSPVPPPTAAAAAAAAASCAAALANRKSPTTLITLVAVAGGTSRDLGGGEPISPATKFQARTIPLLYTTLIMKLIGPASSRLIPAQIAPT